MAPRKGASSLAKMDPNILAQLESGTMETATLTEGLAINMGRLITAIAPDIPIAQFDLNAGIVQRMAQAGALLRAKGDPANYSTHISDTVRGWAAFAAGQDATIEPLKRIDAMRPFAADPHFGVREWAWMAVRAIIVAQPLEAIERLIPWTQDADPHVRRFASEATRPRGVWAASIPHLRTNPKQGLVIIAPLRFDSERYVEDSVANWLNDACKDNPDWVRGLLDIWTQEGVAPRLIKRAGRSLP